MVAESSAPPFEPQSRITDSETVFPPSQVPTAKAEDEEGFFAEHIRGAKSQQPFFLEDGLPAALFNIALDPNEYENVAAENVEVRDSQGGYIGVRVL